MCKCQLIFLESDVTEDDNLHKWIDCYPENFVGKWTWIEATRIIQCMHHVCHMVLYKYMTPLKNDDHNVSPRRMREAWYIGNCMMALF
jgi:hypothetical protein